MATFVIETYLSRARAHELETSAVRLRQAVDRVVAALAPGRPRPRLIRSFYVADDEIAYYILDAASQADAEALAREAGVIPERVVEASSPSS